MTLQTSIKAIEAVRALLATYSFRANDESDLQAQVTKVLETQAHFRVSREVMATRGRYDILVEVIGPDFQVHGADSLLECRLVLELKVAGTAEAAERQAQRYARNEGVDAVAVVTSSKRLAFEMQRAGAFARLDGVECLGGKAFGIITLRSL